MRFASQVTYGLLDASATVTIASGEPVEVLGFIVSNISAGANRRCTVKDNDDNVIMELEADTSQKIIFSTSFIAYNGIKFVNTTGAVSGWSVTCFHSSPGGGISMDGAAPKYSFATLDSAMTVESGSPVKVYGVALMNGTATANVAVTLTDNDGTTIHAYELDPSFFVCLGVPFMANNGLKITSSTANVQITATVFHSNLGA